MKKNLAMPVVTYLAAAAISVGCSSDVQQTDQTSVPWRFDEYNNADLVTPDAFGDTDLDMDSPDVSNDADFDMEDSGVNERFALVRVDDSTLANSRTEFNRQILMAGNSEFVSSFSLRAPESAMLKSFRLNFNSDTPGIASNFEKVFIHDGAGNLIQTINKDDFEIVDNGFSVVAYFQDLVINPSLETCYVSVRVSEDGFVVEEDKGIQIMMTDLVVENEGVLVEDIDMDSDAEGLQVETDPEGASFFITNLRLKEVSFLSSFGGVSLLPNLQDGNRIVGIMKFESQSNLSARLDFVFNSITLHVEKSTATNVSEPTVGCIGCSTLERYPMSVVYNSDNSLLFEINDISHEFAFNANESRILVVRANIGKNAADENESVSLQIRKGFIEYTDSNSRKPITFWPYRIDSPFVISE